ncbi:MAG: hypothetical protein H6868_08325 [Rhodospirillales bacterium]|nr:hypothetical protein [Rhodospirillales bacterium]
MKAQQRNASSYKVCINKRYGTLSTGNCRVQVSVGSPKYEGEKFAALMEWAVRRYEHVQVIVSDTLQRHNGPEPDSPAAWNKARRQGMEWIKRNRLALEGVELVMWDDLLAHPSYGPAASEIAAALRQAPVRSQIEGTAQQFARRNGASVVASINFLTEELAAFALLFQKPAIDVYAGSWISNIFEELKVEMPVFGNVRCLQVDFERDKSALKQAA